MKARLRRIGALVRLSLLELWRRNDMFALLVLAVALLVPLSLARPFGTAGATRYCDDAALILVWGYSIFVSLGVGARLFPGEFSSRTIYPLLAKPVSRGELLAGKSAGKSIYGGVGAFLGFLAGVFFKLAACSLMAIWFCTEVVGG